MFFKGILQSCDIVALIEICTLFIVIKNSMLMIKKYNTISSTLKLT